MKRNRIILLTLLSLFSSQILRSQGNVSYGDYAGNSGYCNSSFGSYAGDLVTGYNNTFNGFKAGKVTKSGYFNVFNGAYAGYYNSTGDYNVYIGYYAAYRATEAHSNVAIGYGSGFSLLTGSDNVFLGRYSGRYMTNGINNVILGYEAGRNATGSNNVLIGYRAGYYETDSNKLYIEYSTDSDPLIYGDFDIDLVAINGNLGIGTSNFDNGQLVVDGKIQAEKVFITTDNFPDYVFDEEYHLLPLRALEDFVKANRHLPGIKPKAVAIIDGISLNEMNVQLLEKIEELTLHVIELDKKRVSIKSQNVKIQKEIGKIQGTIENQLLTQFP